MVLVGDLHRDDLDVVLAGELEDVPETALAVSLERVRVRSRLVCAHPGAHLSMLVDCSQHLLDVLRRVDSAQSGKDVQVVLAKADSVVFEPAGSMFILVPSEDAIGVGNPNHPIHA